MDLNDAARRILRHHWLLILLVTALGLAAPVALDRYREDAFTASARIVFGDTNDAQDANALADTALALATSSTVAEAAVTAAGTDGDPGEVADRVRVRPIGTSGVLELTVTDPDRDGAVALANALAAETVRAREAIVFAESERLLEQITTVLEEERLTVLENLAKEIRPQVVGVAVESVQVPEGQPTRLALGGLLGLLLGVGLAASWEALRPTLSGEGLPRWFGAPVLGRLRSAPGHGADADDPWLADYLRLAAEGAGVHRVQLVSPHRHADLTGLARSLDARTGDGCTVEALDLAAEVPPDSVAGRRLEGVGVVVVCRRTVKARAFGQVRRYLRLSRLPLLGLITHRGRPQPSDEADEPGAAVGAAPDVQPSPATVR